MLTLVNSYLFSCDLNFNNLPHRRLCIHSHCKSKTWLIIIKKYFTAPIVLSCNLLGNKYEKITLFSYYVVDSISLIILLLARLARGAHNTHVTILYPCCNININLYYSCIPFHILTFPALNINFCHKCYGKKNFKVYGIMTINHNFFALFRIIEKLSGRRLPKHPHCYYSQSTFVLLKDHFVFNDKHSIELTCDCDFVGIISVLEPAPVSSVIDILFYYLIVRTNGCFNKYGH